MIGAPDGGASFARVTAAVADARSAAERVFRDAGVEPTAVVVNVTWLVGDVDMAAGSSILVGTPPVMATSLRQSACEVEL